MALRPRSFAALLFFGACVASAQTAPAVLDANAVILVPAGEPGPVVEAAQDLASDMEKVFGRKPRIVDRAEDAASLTVFIGFRSPLAQHLRPAPLAGPESFSISLADSPSRAAEKFVVLTGADMRGTMYAVYQFSQDYLGVDPLYYWTDHEPARRSRIELPAGLKKTFPPPVFKYRGFFINDEDLLTGWANGKSDHTSISLDAWNRIYETTLRLKGNIVAPGTWIFPDEPQISLAGKRGLIITQHHAIPLGVNVARWPKDAPYAYSTHPDILERAWKNAVSAYPPGVEVLWTVGLRGLSDVSYSASDATVAGDNQALGRLITKAMETQVRIVRVSHPDAQFITNLWQEGARLVQQGLIRIPSGVGVVWADDGYGYLQDNGRVSAGNGMYYHVAMMNGRANQLTEMVPVERIASEFTRYIKAGAVNYMLVNTSDIRPVPMTIKAVMDLSWDGLKPDGPAGPAQFYRRWSAAQFGDAAAEKVATIYEDYFKAPARQPGPSSREYGDQYYHTQTRLLLLDSIVDAPLWLIPGQSPTWTLARPIAFPPNPGKESLSEIAVAESARCREAQPRWDALWVRAVEAGQSVSPERRPFYRAHVLAMIAISRESNRMLSLAADAVVQFAAGNPGAARAASQRALEAISEIRKAESAAEYGKWKNWYRGDWLTNVNRTAELLESFLRYLDDPMSPLPPPIRWEGWEAYHHIMQYEGTRSVDVH